MLFVLETPAAAAQEQHAVTVSELEAARSSTERLQIAKNDLAVRLAQQEAATKVRGVLVHAH